ncbi:MAG: DEAD/DEAH box helicase [Endomicrobiia bacterium]
MNNIKKLSFGNKPFLGLVDYILREEMVNKNSVGIIFDSTIDLQQAEHLFLEWEKFLTKNILQKEKVEIIFLGKQISSCVKENNSKITQCFDDIVNILKLKDIEKNKEKFCVATTKEILNLSLEINYDLLTIFLGKEITYEELTSQLVNLGYNRVNYVETIGEYAIRGEIFDIWPNTYEPQRLPYRIIFDENKVVEIKTFDIATQKSIKNVNLQNVSQLIIYPVEIKFNFDTKHNLTSIYSKLDLVLEISDTVPETSEISGYVKTTRYYHNINSFLADLKNFKSQKYKIFIGYNYEYELNKVKEIVQIDNYPITLVRTDLFDGFYNEEIKFLFTTYSEIFAKFEYYHKPHKTYSSVRLEGVWEIQPQDYVVHKDYGIGKYLGMEKISYGENTSEFLNILYKDNAKLYVPVTEFYKVEKFVSLANKEPQLSSLDRISWQRTTKKIKESLKQFVVQLYKIYSSRKKFKGYKCLPDTDFEKQLEESFIYEETEDQKIVINEVKNDLCKDIPMDRIVVGDVGFGKTEVALRAAFKMVMNSKQVVLLCPTTILAEQHYRTFVDRLSAFAVNIGLVTRLQKKSEVENTIREINVGKTDIAIGTHALLNDKIQFPNLGLVIIDEEHKFGVKHKEKIRLKYRQNELMVDNLEFEKNKLTNISQNYEQDIIDYYVPHVLTLTATPIPRTLSIALQGIKDISVIETPPEGRLPVETIVIAYNENIIFNAISKELHRGGQVYYVFNNILLIEHKTNFIKKYFPLARVEFIHSKLPSKKIEDIMLEFMENKIQVLVTTTIIESGLDMPNVNTIIVEDVDKYGLAQLYQLRGRVGRRNIKAFCYFLYNPTKLTENAKKRLAALTEFTSLGSGYKLALRDLEIRGAGELLGTKQHGVVNEIGLSMYSNIVQEILDEINFEQGHTSVLQKKNEPEIELQINAYIPEDYISDSETRIIFYRKILNCEQEEQLLDIKQELYDRFGKPKQDTKIFVDNLFNLTKLKMLLKKYYVKKISLNKTKNVVLEFFDNESLERFYNNFSYTKWDKNNLTLFSCEQMNLLDEIINILSPVRVERTT